MTLKNPKQKGTHAEHKSMRYFEAQGFVCVRSAGSLGAFDFIAFGAQEIILCQVKCNGWPDPAEREKMAGVPCPANCRKEVHRWNDYAREPEVRIVA